MLSRRARFAITAMLEVARRARGKPLAAKILAAGEGVAPRQFETVLQDLVRAGLLRSVRGPLGGYELARERRRIGIGAIVRAVEPGQAVEPPDPAAIASLVAGATAAFLAHLDAVTLDDLCRSSEPADDSQQADFHI